MIRAVIFDLGNTLIYQEPDTEMPIDQLPFVPTPAASNTLHTLAARYRMGIISNMTNSRECHLRKALKNVGWNDLFSAVVTSVDLGARKPNKKLFTMTLDLLASQPHEAIMVGNDIDADINGAAQAGLNTIFYSCNNSDWEKMEASDVKPDYIAKTLDKVPLLIDRLNRV